jgi:thiamine-phosphate pyrophosphorylase
VLPQLLRLIDANLNRSCEGLRVLEDTARFLLNDADLTRRLRALRHQLANETRLLLGADLLQQRDSEHDVGLTRSATLPSAEANMESDEETASLRSLSALVAANAKRAEQALRVMEELARLPEMSSVLNSGSLEQARFALYGIERELASRLTRRDKAERMLGLYLVLDRQFLAGRDELDIAGQAIAGGVRVIQLRDKVGQKGELLRIARKLKQLCSQAGVLLIINDHLDLAIAADADGLHIGPQDLPLSVVRRQLPIDRIVGCSVTTPSQATRAQLEGADYIAAGSIFPTTTKRGATVMGVDTLKEIRRTISVPLVAIGGIGPNNIKQVVAAGADGIAVVSAVLGEKDVRLAVERLIAAMDSAGQSCQDTQKS